MEIENAHLSVLKSKRVLKGTLFFLLLFLLSAIIFCGQDVEAKPSIELRLHRNWGYGGLGGDINGRFTASATVSDDVIRVEFYLDDILQHNDTEPPYKWAFNTNDFPLGKHLIRAVAYDSLGEKTSAEIYRNFVEFPSFPLAIVAVIVVASTAIPLILYRLGLLGGGGATLGLTRCPKCGYVFPRKWSALHLLTSYRNTCPKCGKSFWASKIKETEERPPEKTVERSEEEKLKGELERSKYEEM